MIQLHLVGVAPYNSFSFWFVIMLMIPKIHTDKGYPPGNNLQTITFKLFYITWLFLGSVSTSYYQTSVRL